MTTVMGKGYVDGASEAADKNQAYCLQHPPQDFYFLGFSKLKLPKKQKYSEKNP
jgi:hypothetical protein